MVILNCKNISQYCCFYCIFVPINAAVVSTIVKLFNVTINEIKKDDYTIKLD